MIGIKTWSNKIKLKIPKPIVKIILGFFAKDLMESYKDLMESYKGQKLKVKECQNEGNKLAKCFIDQKPLEHLFYTAQNGYDEEALEIVGSCFFAVDKESN